MKSFFKIFFASLLALVIFSVVSFLIFLGVISRLTSPEKSQTGSNAVLVLDLSKTYAEIPVEDPISAFSTDDENKTPSLYDAVRLINKARSDSAVKGIYVLSGSNANGFGASEELRNALLEFKSSGKFIYSYADVIPQRAYHVANVADRVYCNPKGGVDWRGFAMQLAFVKGTLEKLEIKPQIFYAGKFKSATEPFREYEMTEPNKVQTTELIEDLYQHFLQKTSEQRKIDTATLRQYAVSSSIQFASDALKYRLVDGLRYDDEVKDEIRRKLKIESADKINFISMGKYANAVDFKKSGKDRIGVIYAQGDIIDGKGKREEIGSESYRNMVRKLRLDKNIKAIVLRINSGGGSALASENIWRELTLARKEKPVVISFGDVAASGGYYLSCNADSIFAQPNTITGSIGVFSLLPDMQEFFNNKMGVTFDGVKTAPDADALTVTKPLTDMQKRYLQNSVDSIYHDFKTRVAEGRRMDINYVDSIGQGRIWSGTRALQLHLVDRLGGLSDAIACAARLAKTSDYRLREYPEPQSVYEMIFGSYEQTMKQSAVQEELGVDGMKIYKTVTRVKKMMGSAQARIPFEFTFD